MLWVAVLLVLLVFVLVYGYNRAVALRNRVRQAWADIDVQLQKVVELVPNLVNALKGSAAFERDVLESIARAHTDLVKAMSRGEERGRVEAAARLVNVLYPVIYQIPQYPQLKTVESVRKLMDELSDAMDRIAYARQFYNQAVMEYNTFIQSFPWNIVAALFRFEPEPFFEMREREKAQEMLASGGITEEVRNL